MDVTMRAQSFAAVGTVGGITTMSAGKGTSKATRTESLARIASAQRFVLRVFLLRICLLAANRVMGGHLSGGVAGALFEFFWFASIALTVFAIAALAHRVANRLIAGIVAVLCLVPVVGLLVLLLVNAQATKRLKAAGIEVGILGASPDAI